MDELIFETEKGSLYLRNPETGIWTRKKFNGDISSIVTYLGSADPTIAEFVSNQDGKERVHHHILQAQIYQGEVPGLVPEFVKGYLPIGIAIEPKDIASVTKGRVALMEGTGFRGSHIGHNITKVHKDLSGQFPLYKSFAA